MPNTTTHAAHSMPKLALQPWNPDGSMHAYFFKYRVQLPHQLYPDGKPHAFKCGGQTHYYVADFDPDSGPYVAAYMDRVPLPFFVGVRYQPEQEHERHYQLRCARCVQLWGEDPRNQI